MRMLASEPHVLLLDKPFNNLDSQLRHDFRCFVFEHAEGRGLPTLRSRTTPPTRRLQAAV